MAGPYETTSMADQLPSAAEQAKSEYETAMAECEGISTPLNCANAFKEAVEWAGAEALDMVVEAVAPTHESVFGQALDPTNKLGTPNM